MEGFSAWCRVKATSSIEECDMASSQYARYGILMIQLESQSESRRVFVTALSDFINVPDHLVARFALLLLSPEVQECLIETDHNKICCDRDQLVFTLNKLLNIEHSQVVISTGSYPLFINVAQSLETT